MMDKEQSLRANKLLDNAINAVQETINRDFDISEDYKKDINEVLSELERIKFWYNT